MRQLQTTSAAACVVLAVASGMATAKDPVRAARQYVQRRQVEIVAELRESVAIPNAASDLPDIRCSVAALVATMKPRGVTTMVLESGNAPVLHGEIFDPDLPTVLFYCQYGGKWAEPSEWAQDSP